MFEEDSSTTAPILDSILVSNITSEINEGILRSCFERAGDIQKVTILGSTALVFYEDNASVLTAEMFDTLEISGVKISVQAVNSKEYLSQQPEIIAQVSQQPEIIPQVSSDKDSDDDRKRKESEERKRKDSEERKQEAVQSEPMELKNGDSLSLLKKDTFEVKSNSPKNNQISNQYAFPELVTTKESNIAKEDVVESVVTNDVPIATKKTTVQKNVGLGYNDIKSLLQTTNVPARAKLSDGDPFKEAIGNRVYILGTVAVWSVVWVLSNMFL